MTPQQKSDKYERRLNAGNGIIREQMANYADLAVEISLDQTSRDEIEAARQTAITALDAYCALLKAKAAGASITVNSAPGDKD